MSSGLFDLPDSPRPDVEVLEVVSELRTRDPDGRRFAQVIRDTYDQLYDGQRTGRWGWGQLFKTERTHMGTLVEINLQREFRFEDGDATDYRVAGIEVDCKYSMSMGAWTLPPEVVGHLALVVTANDEKSTWRAGVLRVREEWLNLGRNRDAKTTLKAEFRREIVWLWPDNQSLAPNLFYRLDPADREAIFGAVSLRGGGRDGQARVNELFRRAERRIIRRAELATVAQQDDFMKRARGNGGARGALRAEGYLVLGHLRNEQAVARALGVPVPSKGELVSVRVHPADPNEPAATIEGMRWRLMRVGDVPQIAPVVPRT